MNFKEKYEQNFWKLQIVLYVLRIRIFVSPGHDDWKHSIILLLRIRLCIYCALVASLFPRKHWVAVGGLWFTAVWFLVNSGTALYQVFLFKWNNCLRDRWLEDLKRKEGKKCGAWSQGWVALHFGNCDPFCPKWGEAVWILTLGFLRYREEGNTLRDTSYSLSKWEEESNTSPL